MVGAPRKWSGSEDPHHSGCVACDAVIRFSGVESVHWRGLWLSAAEAQALSVDRISAARSCLSAMDYLSSWVFFDLTLKFLLFCLLFDGYNACQSSANERICFACYLLSFNGSFGWDGRELEIGWMNTWELYIGLVCVGDAYMRGHWGHWDGNSWKNRIYRINFRNH